MNIFFFFLRDEALGIFMKLDEKMKNYVKKKIKCNKKAMQVHAAENFVKKQL